LDTTIGFASHVGTPATKDSDIVTILRRAGAVIYVKTNVPTVMMLAETVNNTFGRTLNPLNRKLTSGGSSGGESALIACRGSRIGIGTDIGGSLRIPAGCTGMSSVQNAAQGRFIPISCRSLQSQAEFWEVSYFGHSLGTARAGSGAERGRPNRKLIDGS
jgi:amidase